MIFYDKFSLFFWRVYYFVFLQLLGSLKLHKIVGEIGFSTFHNKVHYFLNLIAKSQNSCFPKPSIGFSPLLKDNPKVNLLSCVG